MKEGAHEQPANYSTYSMFTSHKGVIMHPHTATLLNLS